jgi:HAE1 family hydrophobic/amphiphilic exporter-1
MVGLDERDEPANVYAAKPNVNYKTFSRASKTVPVILGTAEDATLGLIVTGPDVAVQ